MDNLIVQIKNRSRDPDGRISLRSRYSDRNFVTLQDGIQDRSMEIPRLGIISPPGLSVSGLEASGLIVWYDAFECLTPYGVKCEIPAGRVGLCSSGLSDRIDVITVDALPQYDADGEIMYSGEVQVVTGAGLSHPNIPHIPSSWLKIGEVGICAGSCISTLRSYIPDKVPTPMAAPRVGLSSFLGLYVNPFRGHIGSNARLDFPGGFSPEFSPPGISGMHRLDLLVLNQDAELEIIQGTEALSPERPTAPGYPATGMPIAEVYLQDTDDWMHQDMVSDVRPHFVWPVSSGIEWIPAGCLVHEVPPAPEGSLDGLFPALHFDDSEVESAYYSWRIPRGWSQRAGISVSISWTNVTSVNPLEAVKWGFEYACAEQCSGLSPSFMGVCVCLLNCDDSIETFLRRDARIGLCASSLSPGCILGFRIFRDATDPLDTLAGDAALLGLTMEW